MSKTKALIYQIGRFDRGFINPVRFKISDRFYEKHPLSSFALREHLVKALGYQDAKVVLVYPVSLLLNPFAKSLELPEEFKSKVINLLEEQKEKKEYLKNPFDYFKLHPHSQVADDFMIIHSIGEFEGIKFSAPFDTLVLELLFDMIERYLKERFNVLYLDISSGHNIYVSALIEAGRQFLTFYKLRSWIKEEDPLKVFIVFSDPIIGSSKKEYEIYTDYELDVKVFFSAPVVIRGEDDYVFAKNLTEGDRQLKKKFQRIFSKAYFFFSIIKNNTPLALYTFEHHSLKEIDSAIVDLISFGKQKLFSSYEKPLPISKDNFVKAIFLLSLYWGIIRVLEEYQISVKERVSIKELLEKFCDENKSLYKHFGLLLHRNYLKHEISNNFEKKEMVEKFSSEWKVLKEYVPGETLDKDIKPRNFLAHCGFERNCVEVKKEEDTVYIKYRNEKEILDRIKEILFKS